MEKFCKLGKLEEKTVSGISRYDVCRGEKSAGKLRYDLTRIYPEKFGEELPRTAGHYHTKGQCELFEVMSGRALFFTQRCGDNPKIIKEAYIIEAEEKEKVIILPNFSITSINPEKNRELLLSNWINIDVENEYEDFKNLGGCYLIKEIGGRIEFEKNKNYEKIPELILLRPGKFPAELENLDFLKNPDKYKNILTIENCYRKI